MGKGSKESSHYVREQGLADTIWGAGPQVLFSPFPASKSSIERGYLKISSPRAESVAVSKVPAMKA